MTELSEMLSGFKTAQEQLQYLHQIYAPGNTEVAEAILRIKPTSTDVLFGELSDANQRRDAAKVDELSRRIIDLNRTSPYSYGGTSTIDILFKNGEGQPDPKLVDYAILRLRIKDDVPHLKHALKLVAKGSDPALEPLILERLLEVQIKTARSDSENGSFHAAAKTALKLDRLVVALDLYLESKEVDHLIPAFRIAQEIGDFRLAEIAKRGFDTYSSKPFVKSRRWGGASEHCKAINHPDHHHNAQFYAQCAKFCSRESEKKALKVLVKQAQALDLGFATSYPSDFNNVVRGLSELPTSQSYALLRKMENYLTDHAEKIRPQGLSRAWNDLAEHWLHLKQKDDTVRIDDIVIIYRRKLEVDQKITDFDSVPDDLKKLYELTSDVSYQKQLLTLYDKRGNYVKAMEVAKALNDEAAIARYEPLAARITQAQQQQPKETGIIGGGI